MCTGYFYFYKIEPILKQWQSLLFVYLYLLRLGGELVVVDSIPKFELDKSYSFEVASKYLIMVQHQFFTFNRKLLVKMLFVISILAIVVYLLNFILLVTHLQVYLFQQSLQQIIFMLQNNLLPLQCLYKHFIYFRRSLNKLAQLQISTTVYYLIYPLLLQLSIG